jgi:hypothetical protein
MVACTMDEHENISDATESFVLKISRLMTQTGALNDITPEYTRNLRSNALKQLELTYMCTIFKNTSEKKRKPVITARSKLNKTTVGWCSSVDTYLAKKQKRSYKMHLEEK